MASSFRYVHHAPVIAVDTDTYQVYKAVQEVMWQSEQIASLCRKVSELRHRARESISTGIVGASRRRAILRIARPNGPDKAEPDPRHAA